VIRIRNFPRGESVWAGYIILAGRVNLSLIPGCGTQTSSKTDTVEDHSKTSFLWYFQRDWLQKQEKSYQISED